MAHWVDEVFSVLDLTFVHKGFLLDMHYILIWASEFGYAEGIVLCALTNLKYLVTLSIVDAAGFLV